MKISKITISRQNNFDLIRLLGALQVAILHAAYHLDVDIDGIKFFLKYIPGVPIFFTISGFLIASSFQQSKSLVHYFVNRALRIFPALWACFIFTSLLLISFGVVTFRNVFSLQFLTWVTTQLSFFQFYTPDMLKSWGTGNPNGSLWTIPVEMQFYMFLPLCGLLFAKIDIKFKLAIFIVISIVCNHFLNGREDTTALKLAGVSLFPFLYNFLIGSIIYYQWNELKHWFEGKILWWFLVFVVYCVVFRAMPEYYPNLLGYGANFILSCFIISAAFSVPNLSDKLLKKTDVSYGVYIYHMPIINSLIALKLMNDYFYMALALIFTVLLSFISWFLIEKRAIANKKRIAEKFSK